VSVIKAYGQAENFSFGVANLRVAHSSLTAAYTIP
jgi:hypothetical protein